MTGPEVVRLQALLDQADIPHGPLHERVLVLVEAYLAAHRLLTERQRETDYDRLLRELSEDRNGLLLQLADACLDLGRTEEAKGWGWLAQHKKVPSRIVWVDQQAAWVWFADDDKRTCNGLPSKLWNAIGGLAKRFPTEVAALQAVVEVIASGKWKGT